MQLNSLPLRVLIVDRDAIIRELFTILLKKHGCSVDSTHTPIDAIQLAKVTLPDVIFSSLVFNDMSGFQLCQHLRGIPELSKTYIVALTGYTGSEVRENVKKAGFNEYFLKPVDFGVLLSLLDTVRLERSIENMNS